jgi:hypothetical protein
MDRSILGDLLIIAALLGLFIAAISYIGWKFNRLLLIDPEHPTFYEMQV